MPTEVSSSVEAVDKGESSKPMVGIIYPPPEVRNIVDKTASFVARNGPEFETRIRQNEISNAKFNFLNPGDPYHAYYRHKVKEFLEGKGAEPTAAPVTKTSTQAKPVSQVIEAPVPKDPPPIFEFISDPPSINAIELDVMKLTAQFVARNGRQFLTNLFNKEHRNYMFDFLRPQHSMFNYFTKLVEQYTKVLIPPKDLQSKLQEAAESSKVVMKNVMYRVEWEKLQEKKKQKEEEEKERQRVAYSQIDWHDFVVVETVDYKPNEAGSFPPPIQVEEVGSRVIAEERFEQFGEELKEEEDVEMEVEEDEDEDEDEEDEEEEESDEETEEAKAGDNVGKGDIEEDEEEVEEVVAEREKLAEDAPTPPETETDQNVEVQDMEEGDSDMEESSGDEEEEEEKKGTDSANPEPPKDDLPVPPPLPPQPGEVQIRKDYDPKVQKQAAVLSGDNFLISPLTGEKIPADKMEEHMRIGLLDPRWIEQVSKAKEGAGQEEVYAPGGSMKEYLERLAERRTDIFGEGDVETQIGKKIGEEEDPTVTKKVIWDGHSASMEATTRKAQANITIEEQIEALHKAQGLLPDEEKERIGPKKTTKRDSSNKPKPPQQPPPPPKVQNKPAPKPAPIPPPPRPQMSIVMPPPVPIMQTRPVLAMGQPGILTVPPGMTPAGVPPPPPLRQPPPPMQPPHQAFPPHHDAPFQPQNDGEPMAKRQKTEEDLIPEARYLAMNRGPVTFSVLVPNVSDKPEWRLNGQMLQMTLPLADQVSVIKAKIFEELGMPTGKQKLQYEGMFIKDSNTLAFYNFNYGGIVQLQVKERGGRKR